MTPEGKVKKAVRELLRAKGVWYYQPVQNGMGQVGIPDFVCCYKGTFIAIETKAPGKLGNVSEPQKIQIEGIHKSLGIALVVDDVAQLDMLEEVLTS